jgi:hypothetical protein
MRNRPVVSALALISPVSAAELNRICAAAMVNDPAPAQHRARHALRDFVVIVQLRSGLRQERSRDLRNRRFSTLIDQCSQHNRLEDVPHLHCGGDEVAEAIEGGARHTNIF